ncbi:hypothetical protein [Endozoicomonas euniceicola]|uniref:Flagellin N-terminal domain-containing protein n=1 Tax=Endozoicomonas euniceicola TaxID=1234143 RepID=A0ABY6GUS3_9GAMM|nr:hypothetical protein [Endozoicomonas euniceicola]UYM15694.1 hypothetical protein NX720_23160 [Endozoicomonas euniceicola]
MRISTMQMNNTMANNIMSTSSSINRILMQLATGKKILKPSDDTLASTQILGLDDANKELESYGKNLETAKVGVRRCLITCRLCRCPLTA